MLTGEEKARYNRHIILDQVGREGQEKLKVAKVLVIGAGGLGCPILQYLTAAGVGTIGIVDFDTVDASNLQRQVLFDTTDVGQGKAEVAARKLALQNPYVSLVTHPERLTSENALDLFKAYDIIVDGTDNFPTRYLVNDACVLTNKPLVFGSIFKFEGQVAVFNYEGGPTYRCLFPTPPEAGEVPNCAQIGVIGVLPGLIGTIQANEVIKLITSIGSPLSGKLLVLDALTMNTMILEVQRSENASVDGLIDYEDFCGVNEEVHRDIASVSPKALAESLAAGKDMALIDVREIHEWEICKLPDATLIPLGMIPDEVAQIPRDQPVVVYCHHGMRSAMAIAHLQEQYGFRNLVNLEGGIDQWSLQVDTGVRRY